MYRLVVFLYLLAIAFGDNIPKPKSHRNTTPFLPCKKIVGGGRTSFEDVPYLISITNYMGFLLCGGSIITKRHILTSHSCLTRHNIGVTMEYSDLIVKTGTSGSENGGTDIKPKSLKGHPKYNSKTNDYDVSVIELEEDIQLSSTFATITLAETEAVSGNALVAGWRCNSSYGVAVLQSVVVPIVNRTECEKAFHNRITARMICAGKNKKKFCDYDYGGPLVVGEKNMRTQVGIGSSNVDCGDPDYPGVYTNIADPEIRAFIKEQAGV